MSAELDDKFAEHLALLDERIASGAAVAAETLIDEPDLSVRLDDALDCLQLLEEIWPRQASTAVPAMPRVFGRYRVVRELGRGGFGVVHLAEDLQLARDVAIKVQRPEAVLSIDARKRFLREARASAPLKHPNLVTVYDSGEEGLWCWIASEVIHGPSLHDFMEALHAQSELPPVRDAVHLVRDLADGVAHAHSQGVLHRDIKPANVLLDPRCERPEVLADYRAKLTDFGLARSLEGDADQTQTGARLGTPAYMAPEQLEGRNHQIGPATDVYGLGVLLYELLLGRSPFASETESGVLKQVLLTDPASLRNSRPEVARDLEAVVFKALEKDPERRYANARALAEDLSRVLAGEPTTARPLGAVRRAYRWARKHPGLCIATGAVLISVAAMAIIGDLSRKNHELLGIRKVWIETSPSGATVAFAPIDPATGDPIASAVFHGVGLTPMCVEMVPADYLIVAVLPDGRFHEVLRHVPARRSQIPHQYQHYRWRELSDGTLQLPGIEIPSRTATHGMVLVEDTAAKAERRPPAYEPFYLDPLEVAYEKFAGSRPDIQASSGTQDPQYAAEVGYDQATQFAEKRGARLPSEAEFLAAVAHCRRVADLPPSAASRARGFAPVGIPENDQTDTNPPIIGLRSNVAEWTTGRSVDGAASPERQGSSGMEVRTVRGGSREMIGTRATYSTDIRTTDDPELRVRFWDHKGVGFRCARSAKPRFVEIPTE